MLFFIWLNILKILSNRFGFKKSIFSLIHFDDIDRLSQNNVDACVTDIKMSGNEPCRVVRRRRKGSSTTRPRLAQCRQRAHCFSCIKSHSGLRVSAIRRCFAAHPVSLCDWTGNDNTLHGATSNLFRCCLSSFNLPYLLTDVRFRWCTPKVMEYAEVFSEGNWNLQMTLVATLLTGVRNIMYTFWLFI